MKPYSSFDSSFLNFNPFFFDDESLITYWLPAHIIIARISAWKTCWSTESLRCPGLQIRRREFICSFSSCKGSSCEWRSDENLAVGWWLTGRLVACLLEWLGVALMTLVLWMMMETNYLNDLWERLRSSHHPTVMFVRQMHLSENMNLNSLPLTFLYHSIFKDHICFIFFSWYYPSATLQIYHIHSLQTAMPPGHRLSSIVGWVLPHAGGSLWWGACRGRPTHGRPWTTMTHGEWWRMNMGVGQAVNHQFYGV